MSKSKKYEKNEESAENTTKNEPVAHVIKNATVKFVEQPVAEVQKVPEKVIINDRIG